MTEFKFYLISFSIFLYLSLSVMYVLVYMPVCVLLAVHKMPCQVYCIDICDAATISRTTSAVSVLNNETQTN